MKQIPDNWPGLKDEDLLERRICDLNLKIEGSELQERIQQLYKELEEKKIFFSPPCYLADEWFVPDGETVIGIPFYLGHPRLRKLEHKIMLEVEGETELECMRLLRHEAGHVLQHAYRLHKKRGFKKIFGNISKNETVQYRPKPYSKAYVRHLENWYAQSDPDEDFAETFAVWLTPGLNWKKHYGKWKALQKLEYVDQLMKQIAGQNPPVISNDQLDAASKIKIKLKTYYRRKRKLFEEDYPEFYDPELKKIFSADPEYVQNEKARDFMRRNGKMIVDKVSRWTGERKFTINNLIKRLMERCGELSLKLCKGKQETVIEICAYLTAMVSNYLFTGKFKRSV